MRFLVLSPNALLGLHEESTEMGENMAMAAVRRKESKLAFDECYALGGGDDRVPERGV